jgi:hypothetical protein
MTNALFVNLMVTPALLEITVRGKGSLKRKFISFIIVALLILTGQFLYFFVNKNENFYESFKVNRVHIYLISTDP